MKSLVRLAFSVVVLATVLFTGAVFAAFLIGFFIRYAQG